MSRRICTDEEVAEVLDGFEEEMLASIRRNKARGTLKNSSRQVATNLTR